MRVAARAIAINAVVLSFGTQRTGQRERLAGLAMAPEQLHRAAEAEQRVVVRGRAGGDRLELLRGAVVAAGMKQRPAERLADRGLLRLAVAGLAERHDRRLVVAVVEQLAAALVQVVHAFHGGPF